MKTLLLLVCVPMLMFGQRTTYKNSSGTASVDTLIVSAHAVTRIVGVSINTHIANDSIYIKDGGQTIALFIVGGTAPAGPVFLPINTQVDSAYVIVERKKTSNVTTFFQRK